MTELERHERAYKRVLALIGNLVWLTIFSVLPVIWIPWLWKITATLAMLTFIVLLIGLGIHLAIDKIKESEK